MLEKHHTTSQLYTYRVRADKGMKDVRLPSLSFVSKSCSKPLNALTFIGDTISQQIRLLPRT